MREFVPNLPFPSCKSLRALFCGWRLLVVVDLLGGGGERKYAETVVDMHLGAWDTDQVKQPS